MNDSYQVYYSEDAYEDLKGIYSYILNTLQAPKAALSITERLRKEIRSLEDNPSRYSLVQWEPWFSKKIRKLPVKNYIVFYVVDDKARTVTVVRIFYGGRDIEGIISSEVQ